MDAPQSTRDLCRVYNNFRDQCFALAMDPEPGTYGVGYRIARDQGSLFSYSFKGPVMTFDPASTGIPGWEEFLQGYNEFASAPNGVPLLNQSHVLTRELYVVIEGVGRIRVDDDLLELPRMSALYVSPESVRQVINDTDADALWLVFGAPPEAANTLEMSEETIAHMYPDGLKALPPELTSA